MLKQIGLIRQKKYRKSQNDSLLMQNEKHTAGIILGLGGISRDSFLQNTFPVKQNILSLSLSKYSVNFDP